jgi:hypothetical protein
MHHRKYVPYHIEQGRFRWESERHINGFTV